LLLAWELGTAWAAQQRRSLRGAALPTTNRYFWGQTAASTPLGPPQLHVACAGDTWGALGAQILPDCQSITRDLLPAICFLTSEQHIAPGALRCRAAPDRKLCTHWCSPSGREGPVCGAFLGDQHCVAIRPARQPQSLWIMITVLAKSDRKGGDGEGVSYTLLHPRSSVAFLGRGVFSMCACSFQSHCCLVSV
jgi:hypothetical protein